MPNKKKQTRRKKSAKKTKPKRNVARKRVASKQTTAKRNTASIKAASKRFLARKTKFSAKRRRLTSTGLVVETVPPVRPDVLAVPRRGAGDLQGLSNNPEANSESVEELLEEGNALEAEAVQGVENALDADQGEVRTKELPEDDVPQEYLDKDR
jgi:hypothetical protein